MVPRAELERDSDLKRALRRLEGSEAAARFLATYGKNNVKAQYAFILGNYDSWLKAEKGVGLSLDELVRDNLACVWKSDPVDVDVKRRHRAWLEEHVNVRLAQKSLSYRRGITSVVKGFYEKNDSPLFGTVRVAESAVEKPAKALRAEEIRAVLKAPPSHLERGSLTVVVFPAPDSPVMITGLVPSASNTTEYSAGGISPSFVSSRIVQLKSALRFRNPSSFFSAWSFILVSFVTAMLVRFGPALKLRPTGIQNRF